MWTAIASFALDKINKNHAQDAATRSNEITGKKELLMNQQKNILDRTQAENMSIMNQRSGNTQQQVFDEIMKKYNVRL